MPRYRVRVVQSHYYTDSYMIEANHPKEAEKIIRDQVLDNPLDLIKDTYSWTDTELKVEEVLEDENSNT